MSRPREWNWKESLAVYLTALLLALGMSLTFFKALLPQQAAWPSLLWCALFTLVFQGLFSLRFRFKGLLVLLAALLSCVWLAFGGGPLYPVVQGVKAAFLSFNGVPEAAAPYAGALRWAVCFLFSLLSAALAWDRSLALSLFAVITVVALSFVLGGQAQLLLYALPAAAGLLMLLAEEQGKRPATLAVAILLAVGAFLLLPGAPRTIAPLEKAATDIRQFVEDYLLFNEFRSTFSLTTEGYQPLNDRLGGPAHPAERAVMEVETARTVLLRGRTYDDYSGLNWYDTLSARRYLFSSPRFTAQRDDLFDLKRPLAGPVLPAEDIRVRMLSGSPTTLFAPCRTLALRPESERMVLYYNLAAERFITRDLQADDRYALSYLPYAPGLPETAQAVAANALTADPYFAEVSQRYLTVPRHIQQDIYDIAARAAEGAATPYEKALGIQRYLQTHYAYTLDVKTPPEGVDFAAWFLIGEKQGYCTYFATAMTLLCRIAGVPARYVTGYLAVPDDNGVAVVTGENAHAWTEVYLNGFGWLDFDATPRRDNRRGSDSGESPSGPDESPSHAPSPSPSPSPAAQEAPTPTPEPTEAPPENDESQPPTPTPEPSAPEDSPTPPPAPPDDNPRFPWWVILLALLIIGLLALRFFLTEPLRRSRRRPDQAAAVLYAGIGDLLSAMRLRRAPHETLHAFAARADETLRGRKLPEITPLTNAYAAQLYGHHPADPAPFAAAYQALRDRASRWTRLRLAVRRILGRRQ